MLKLCLTAIALGLVAGAACAQTAPVDEYHHAIPVVKGTATIKKPLALKNDVLPRKQPAKVYLLENRTPHVTVDDKHDSKNW